MKRKTDPVYKLKQSLRCRLWYALKSNYKAAPTMELVGCTAQYARQWIESQFKDGMTWDNYGKNGGWEIDHRIPQSYFTSVYQLKECFALSNLKPEWGNWNMSKGNRFIG